MFEGLLNKSLTISEDDLLYRGSKMSRLEIDKIIKLFEIWKEKQDKSLPSFLLYSRCFLSFTKDEDRVIDFIGKTDDIFYGILFKLKNNNKITNKYSSNVDVEFLSAYSNEKEVLFFLFLLFA